MEHPEIAALHSEDGLTPVQYGIFQKIKALPVLREKFLKKGTKNVIYDSKHFAGFSIPRQGNI